MFTLQELVRWLGLSEFEIFTNLVSLWLFTIALALKISGYFVDTNIDWYTIFLPLFCSDIFNGYFCVIVGIRMYMTLDNKRKALQRVMWSAKYILLTGVFKYLLCIKLAGAPNLEFCEVCAPIFVLLQLIAIRGCQTSSSTT